MREVVALRQVEGDTMSRENFPELGLDRGTEAAIVEEGNVVDIREEASGGRAAEVALDDGPHGAQCFLEDAMYADTEAEGREGVALTATGGTVTNSLSVQYKRGRAPVSLLKPSQ